MNQELDKLRELVRKDIEKPVEEWTEQDKQDWRDMGWKLPRKRTI